LRSFSCGLAMASLDFVTLDRHVFKALAKAHYGE
jgi:hypothetical protein